MCACMHVRGIRVCVVSGCVKVCVCEVVCWGGEDNQDVR